MDLVDLAVQAIDGSKIGANASKDRTYDKKGLQKLLERTEKVIEELEQENETGTDPAPVHLPEKLRKAEQLRVEVKAAMAVLAAEEGPKHINLTDSESNLMKTRQGFVTGYNLEAVVSPLKVNEAGKTGLIMTAVEVVTEAADVKQLIPMLEQAEENIGKQAEKSLTDAGFHSGANLAACEKREQVIVMPEVQARALTKPYHKDSFIYDINTDSYQCPCGQTLQFARQVRHRQTEIFIYRGLAAVCRQCAAFGTCTKSKHHGRVLEIGEYEAALRRHRVWMATEEAKEAYKRRKEIIEPSFGILKEVLGVRRFLLRGWYNVRAEAGVLATAFNLRSLYGVWKGWTAAKRRKLFTWIGKAGNNISANSAILALFKEKTRLAC